MSNQTNSPTAQSTYPCGGGTWDGIMQAILFPIWLTKQSLNLATFFTNLSAPRTFIYSGEATAGPPIYKGCFPTQTAYATAYVAGQTYFALPNTMIWRSPTNTLTVTWQYPNLTLASVAGSVMTLVSLRDVSMELIADGNHVW
jgi:hypothetical protein